IGKKNASIIKVTMLKLILIILGLFYLNTSTSQINVPITKINILYAKGHSSWGDPGKYGSYEYMEFMPTANGNFKFSKYLRVTQSAGLDGKTYSNDTTDIAIKKYPSISNNTINDWIFALNTTKDNYTEKYLKPLLNIPKKKTIYQVSKEIDKLWEFKRKYSKEEETGKIINNIKSFHLLDTFLTINKPNLHEVLVVSDVWNRMRIEVIRDKDTILHQCDFFRLLGHPVYKIEHRDFENLQGYINSEINVIAQSFLPPKSLLYKALDINNITKEYIKWYLYKFL
ncbi:MAG TPA: hypothetical protein PLU37_08775, partial [Chitinophagaceae bacterium]|nr:hypothetical protein [Chitinophagaceae bacterium]